MNQLIYVSVFQMCSIELITMFTRVVLTMNIWKETNAKVLKRKKKESQRVINVHFKISFLPYSDNCLILILVNRIHFEND